MFIVIKDIKKKKTKTKNIKQKEKNNLYYELPFVVISNLNLSYIMIKS